MPDWGRDAPFDAAATAVAWVSVGIARVSRGGDRRACRGCDCHDAVHVGEGVVGVISTGACRGVGTDRAGVRRVGCARGRSARSRITVAEPRVVGGDGRNRRACLEGRIRSRHCDGRRGNCDRSCREAEGVVGVSGTHAGCSVTSRGAGRGCVSGTGRRCGRNRVAVDQARVGGSDRRDGVAVGARSRGGDHRCRCSCDRQLTCCVGEGVVGISSADAGGRVGADTGTGSCGGGACRRCGGIRLASCEAGVRRRDRRNWITVGDRCGRCGDDYWCCHCGDLDGAVGVADVVVGISGAGT